MEKTHFPKCLFGDRATTKRAFKKLVMRAWTTSWNEAMLDEEVAAVSDFPGMIIVERSRAGCVANIHGSYLRPYWVYDTPDIIHEWCFSRDVNRNAAFVLSGADYLWFLLGSLRESLQHALSIEDGARYHVAMLEKFAPHLPAIDRLAPRFASEGFAPEIYRLHFPFIWTLGLRNHIRGAGVQVANHGMTHWIDDRYQGSVTKWLESERLIEQVDGRYRLCSPLPRAI